MAGCTQAAIVNCVVFPLFLHTQHHLLIIVLLNVKQIHLDFGSFCCFFNQKTFLNLKVCQVKDGQVARAHLVDLVTQGHRGGPGIQGPQDQLASLDTVMQTPVWDTTWEVNIIYLHALVPF